MIEIRKAISADIGVLDTIAREALSDAVAGVSINTDLSRIHLINESQSNRDRANAVLDNYGNLAVNADKTAMTEGDADPVISCNDGSIAGDADLGYSVLLDGAEYDVGAVNVVSNTVTLNLIAPVVGVYTIYVYRRTGNYASGSVTITVN